MTDIEQTVEEHAHGTPEVSDEETSSGRVGASSDAPGRVGASSDGGTTPRSWRATSTS